MKRILITGGAGQLGSEIKDLYQNRSDVETIFIDREELGLDNIEAIFAGIGVYKPEIIIHGGAYTAVDRAETEPELADKVNHLASREIAKYCQASSTKLIAISTDYVFDGNSSSPLNEEAAVSPINVYGNTKLKGEQAIQAYLPEAIIIRTAWVYSAYGHNFVKTMLRLMGERDEISVINDQIGSPTYALDLAKAIVNIIDSEKWDAGIYNFSNEGEVSWFELAEAIKDIKGLDCKINPIPSTAYPTPAKRPKFSLLDKSKIKATFPVKVPFWKDSLRVMLTKV